jgi:transcriptional regulator with XRE-family HTH domain
MPELGATIRGRRAALGMEQTDLAEAIGSTPRQVSRWENDTQEPTASNVRKIARALGVSTDELLGEVPMGLDLSGQWFAAWDTSRDRAPVIDTHELTATHRGIEFTFAATGDYLWSGTLRHVDGSLMGTYLSTEANKMYRGSLYFTLDPVDASAAIGRWSGLWADGLVGGGWGVLSRDEDRAMRLMTTVKNHEGPLTEWPQEGTV